MFVNAYISESNKIDNSATNFLNLVQIYYDDNACIKNQPNIFKNKAKTYDFSVLGGVFPLALRRKILKSMFKIVNPRNMTYYKRN